MTFSYLVEQQVQGAIAHKLCDDAEELGLVADAKDLDDVVEPGFVEHLGLLQQAVPLPETQPAIQSQVIAVGQSDRSDDMCGLDGVHRVTGRTLKGMNLGRGAVVENIINASKSGVK